MVIYKYSGVILCRTNIYKKKFNVSYGKYVYARITDASAKRHVVGGYIVGGWCILRRLIYADFSIFNVFSFPLLKGAANQALRRPESVVIPETMVRKYFGQENLIVKTIQFTTWTTGLFCNAAKPKDDLLNRLAIWFCCT